MKKNVYICNAKQLVRVIRHTNIASIAYPLVYTGNSVGCLATNSKGVRSLFVHTFFNRITC